MMRPVPGILFFIWLAGLMVTGCRSESLDVNVSGIEAEVAIERFDRELFRMDEDTLNGAIGYFYTHYGNFYDVFNVHIIGIGPASSRRYPAYLSMFINDPTNREVYRYAERIFPDTEQIDEKLSDGFRHYLYHYPDSTLPRVIGYVSRFNQGLFTVNQFVGVGLDQYLGSDCPYYDMLGTPQYLRRNKVPGRIPVDVMFAWATRLYPYNDSVDNVLNRMVYQGMLTYFVEAMYPAMEDSVIMGFTAEQMRWCRNNEKQMWTHLVEEKLIFSTDELVIRKLVEEAPYTSYFTSESPGRAAAWQGWQIVRTFASRNQELTLDRVLSRRDYQELLRMSRYNP